MLKFLLLKTDAFGLDISDFSLKIAKLKKKGNDLKLVSWGEFPLKPGIIEAGEIKDEAALIEIVKDSIGKVKGEKLKTNYVVVSLPEEKAFLQVIKLPRMKEEEIAKAISYEIENYIPLSVDEVYWDFQVVEPLISHPERLDVLIAAMPQKIVASYLSVFKGAGLKPLALEIESEATTRALIGKGKNKKQILIVDLGATHTGFTILVGSSLVCIFSIPVCGRIFDAAIAKELRVTPAEAEKLKIKYGLNQKMKIKIKDGAKKKIEKGRIFETLIPSLTDLLEQIGKYLDYYRTHIDRNSQTKKVEKILLCGGGAYMKGLKEFLHQELKIPVELGDPLAAISVEIDKKTGKKALKKPLRYTTAIGLAMRATKS